MAAAVLFGAASCAKEDISSSIANGEQVEVTFTANLPELGTRAYGDGTNVNVVYVNVYEAGSDILLSDLTLDDGYPVSSKQAKVNIALIKGMKYDIVFWAQDKYCGHYTLNGKEVTVNYENATANDNSRDAFYAYVNNFDPVAPAGKDQVKLYRPFAQINAATDDLASVEKSGIKLSSLKSGVVIKKAYKTLNIADGSVSNEVEVTFAPTTIPAKLNEPETLKDDYDYLAMNYVLVGDKKLVNATLTVRGERINSDDAFNLTVNEYTNVPLQRNYRTNILGLLITRSTDFTVEIKPGFDNSEYEVEGDVVTANVDTVEEFAAAFADNSGIDVVVLNGDINLNDLLTRAEATDPSFTLAHGKELTIDLNGKTLSATSAQTGTNYNMFDVRGTLTVKNGTIEYKHEGENMGWGASTNIFNVTAGGILNLAGVTATNLGGSDMGFVAHLNNWGEVTLNVENSTLESNYVPVRVFNSGPDMNNVSIKNSTLKGGSAAFWVHNYTAVDFGTEAKAEAQKALLNFNIYNQGNTFSPDINGIRYGFTNSIRTDAYGITKTVSEDGTEVTLGSIVENGLIRRGVAGDEENTTITKVVVEEGVGVLYDRTFRRFYALETVELPSTLTTIGAAGSGVFQSCTALKNIVLPESVTVLGKGSFQECSSLESINIPAGVTRIEEKALCATGLKEVEFHAGVTYFGTMAFRDCKQLTKVVINAPEFTMEGDTFGIMAAPFTPMTIEVANAEMKAYVESKLTAHAKTYITVVAPEVASNAADLQAALTEGKYVALSQDIFTEATTTAPYGNKYGFKMDGGVLDGNNYELDIECYGDDYGIMTSGGTIKNLTIDNGTRAIMLMYANQDVILDNVNLGGDGVLYPINTGEAGVPANVNLVVTNSTIAGWTSYGNINSASFTNVEFKQGTYYNNIYGRVLKPYVNTVFTNCSFIEHMNLDLSALTNGHKITIKNCTVNGQAVTTDVFTVPANDAQYDTELFTIDLPSWATSVADCVIFE